MKYHSAKNPWCICKLASITVSSIMYYYVLYYALDLVAPIHDACIYILQECDCMQLHNTTHMCMYARSADLLHR